MVQKYFLLSAVLILSCLNASGQQPLIALEHNGSSSFFTDIPSAVSAAMSGDTIYLPGGIFPGFSIDKTLTIVGAGHHPDYSVATTLTIISGGITMTTPDCDGSVFSGFKLTGGISTSGNNNDNIQISRCNMSSIAAGSGSENWTITECISGSIQNLSNSFVSNNIITGGMNFNSNCQIENNIVFGTLYTDNYCVFKNNIFRSVEYYNPIAGVYYFTNCLFYNNIWNGGTFWNGDFGAGNFGVGNIIDTNFDGLFESYSYSTYLINFDLYQFDFNLVNPAYNTGGTNGSTIGIYGGLSPWKDGSVPFNPHIQLQQINGSTDPSGNLNVNIQVEAQDN